MSRYPKELIDDFERADMLVLNSFGTATAKDSVNRSLVEYALEIASGRPIVADAMTAQLMPFKPAHEVVGEPSSPYGQGVDTWKIQKESVEFAMKHGLETPIEVAHRNHMGRVALQAFHAGFQDVIIPPEHAMPSHFDRTSAQVWTRNRAFWAIRESVGYPVLRILDRL